MLSVLLTILKVLGIILLVILGIILLLLLIVLLVPVRYSFGLQARGTKVHLDADAGWLLKAVYAVLKLDGTDLIYRIRLLWFTIATNDQAYLKKEAEKKKSEDKSDKPAVTEKPATEKKTAAEEKPKEEKPKEEKPSIEEKPKEEKPVKKEEVKEEKKTGPPEEKESFFDKLGRKIESFVAKLEELEKKGEDLEAKIEEMPLEVYYEQAVKWIPRLLRHVLPRKLKGWITYGFRDPYLTGEVTAYAAAFYPVYGDHFLLDPDFEQKIFEADCSGKGRIRLGYLAYVGIRLFLVKEIRSLIFKLIKDE